MTSTSSSSERGVEIFFTQVFSHNFFHADMHPATSSSARRTVHRGRFRHHGTLSAEDQRYLAENFSPSSTAITAASPSCTQSECAQEYRVDEFESAIRSVCEPIFERPLKDISFGRLLLNLLQTARRFDGAYSRNWCCCRKPCSTSRAGSPAHPDLDLWKTAKPFRTLDVRTPRRA